MRRLRILLSTAVLLVLAACGSDTSSPRTDATPETPTTIAVPADDAVEVVAVDGYERIAHGPQPIDAGPGSILNLLLNQLPAGDPFEVQGMQPAQTQLKTVPLVEGCPDPAPIAYLTRQAGRLAPDLQSFDVVAGASVMVFADQAEAQSAFDALIERVAECDALREEVGFELHEWATDLSIETIAESTVVEPAFDIDGLVTMQKVTGVQQFGADIEQTIRLSHVVRGAAIWSWTIATLPEAGDVRPIDRIGETWMRKLEPFVLPDVDAETDARVEATMKALEIEIARPDWFEPAGAPTLEPTRLTDGCTSFRSEPIVTAQGTPYVAVSQFSFAAIEERVAAFRDESAAGAEVDHWLDEGAGCLRRLFIGSEGPDFRFVDDSTEELEVDGTRIVVNTIDYLQANEFDVRVIGAIGVRGSNAVAINFNGVAGDEADLPELIAARLELLESGG